MHSEVKVRECLGVGEGGMAEVEHELSQLVHGDVPHWVRQQFPAEKERGKDAN